MRAGNSNVGSCRFFFLINYRHLNFPPLYDDAQPCRRLLSNIILAHLVYLAIEELVAFGGWVVTACWLVVKLRTHEQTLPVPKICQVKSQSLDYMANKVPVDLRGRVAVAESPHWSAWPYGPTTKKRAVQPSSKNANFWKPV